MATVTPISTVRAVLDAGDTDAATLAVTTLLQGAEADPTKIGAEYLPDASALTSGPVTSSGGVSAIADAALTIAKTNGLQAALTDASNLGTNSLNLPQRLNIPGPYTALQLADSPPRTGGQVTHPSIIEIPTLFQGWRYVMAYTTNVNSQPVDYENVCIAVSNDKINWSIPAGQVNPIALKAEAVTYAGVNGYWSDPEILYDGTKLVVYFRAQKPTGDSGNTDTLVVKTTTNFTSWTATTAITSAQAFTTLISPTVVKESESLYNMWTCSTGANQIIRRSCSTSTGLFTTDVTTCKLPVRTSVWHMQVKKYQGIYYMLLATGTSADGFHRLSMLWSLDGIIWKGDTNKFLPVTGTTQDAGGNYRSAFLPKGGWPCKFDVWATQMDVPQNEWSLVYSEREYDIRPGVLNTPDTYRLNLVDNFVSCSAVAKVAGTSHLATFGELGWELYHDVSNGTAQSGGGLYDVNSYGFGGCKITTGAQTGATTSIRMATYPGLNTTTTIGKFTQIDDSVVTIRFKMTTSATGDAFYWGLGDGTMSGSLPYFWVGLKVVKGTDTNFQFAKIDNGVTNPNYTTLVNSLGAPIALDTNWHRFQMGWDKDTDSWRARLDDSPWQIIPNTATAVGGGTVNFSSINQEINIGGKIRAGTAAAAGVLLQGFQLQGNYCGF